MHNRSVVFNIKTDLQGEDARTERLQGLHHFIDGIDSTTASSEFDPGKKTCKLRFRFGPQEHRTIQVIVKLKPLGADLYEVEAKGEIVDLTAFCQRHFPGQKPEKLLRPRFEKSLKKAAKRHGTKETTAGVELATPAAQPHMLEPTSQGTEKWEPLGDLRESVLGAHPQPSIDKQSVNNSTLA